MNALALVVAYLFGSIPFGYLIVKLSSGADIRQTGSGGTGATNVIPGSLELTFNWRYGTASTRESLVRVLREVLDRHSIDYELAFPSSGRPYFTPPGRLVGVVSEAIREICGHRPVLSTSGGTSDGRFIADLCPEIVELGPVNATIHQVDERIQA